MAGHRRVGPMGATQTDGYRRFEYMEAKRGLAGHILAIIAVLVARSVPAVEGEGEVGIAPTMLALANGRGLIHQWHVWW